jgi:hypothetical protein
MTIKPDDEKYAFKFFTEVSNGPKEIVRFSITGDDRLHIEWNEKLEVTDAARRFIAVVRDQLENIGGAETKMLSPSGDN